MGMNEQCKFLHNSDSRNKFMQAMCNAANNHNAAAKERIEKEYGFIAGVDAMLWSIQNYFYAEAEKMEKNEEESQEDENEAADDKEELVE